jgi:hypothetical protein
LTPDLLIGNSIDIDGNTLTYQFELYNGAGTVLLAQSPMVNSGSSSTAWTVTPKLKSLTNYTWRARAYDGQAWSLWTTSQNFRTGYAFAVPLMENALGQTTSLTLDQILGSFDFVDYNGDPISYQLEFYDDRDSTLPLKAVTISANPLKNLFAVSNDLLSGKSYWWRVRATDGTDFSEWTALAPLATVVSTVCGDLDSSGVVDISDAIYFLNYLYTDGPSPRGSGDVNCNGVTDISDAILLIEFIFANGYQLCGNCSW